MDNIKLLLEITAENKTKFREMAKKFHPDKGGDLETAKRIMNAKDSDRAVEELYDELILGKKKQKWKTPPEHEPEKEPDEDELRKAREEYQKAKEERQKWREAYERGRKSREQKRSSSTKDAPFGSSWTWSDSEKNERWKDRFSSEEERDTWHERVKAKRDKRSHRERKRQRR